MSAEAQPISAAAFASALESLPAENLYTKAVEIRNSIAHLERSNIQLQEYSDSIANDTSIPADVRGRGDAECLEAIRENIVVIERQRDRIALLKAEMERRGGRWHEVEVTEAPSEETNGALDVDGTASDRDPTPELTRASTMDTMTSQGGRLTDEALRRQLAERMGEDDENGEGMQL